MSNNNLQINDSNQRSLSTLLRSLKLSQSKHSWTLVRCNHNPLGEEMMQRLEELHDGEIGKIKLTKETTQLHIPIQKLKEEGRVKAVIIYGLEGIDIGTWLINLKRSRYTFKELWREISLPIIIWTNDDILKQIARLAPYFWCSHFFRVINF